MFSTRKQSPFLNPYLTQELGKYANKLDLLNLRQLNQKIYGVLNPAFLNSLNGTLSVVLVEKPKDANEYLISINEKLITRRNWDPAFACSFIRNLDLCDICCGSVVSDGLLVCKLITTLKPHITSLTLGSLPSYEDSEEPLATLMDFIEQFENLEQIHFSSLDSLGVSRYSPRVWRSWNTSRTVELSQFKNFLKDLCSITKYQVQITITSNHDRMLTQFGNGEEFPNVQFVVSIPGTKNDYWQANIVLTNIFKRFALYMDSRLKFNIDFGCITNLSQLKQAASSILKYQEHIEQDVKMQISLKSTQNAPLLLDREIKCVKLNFEKLRPFLTDLVVTQYSWMGKETDWNILINPINMNRSRSWPKLRELSLHYYGKQNLEIFPSCPLLKKCQLWTNPKSCLFQKRKDINNS